jgi:hypothetical protein
VAIYNLFGLKPSRFRVVSGTGLTDVPISYINEFEMDPNITELEFEGDGTTLTVPVSTQINGTLTVMAFNTDWLTIAAGVTRTTAGLATGAGAQTPGIASLMHPELGTYPYVQMEVDMRAQDAAGTEKQLRTIVWKTKLQNPITLSGVGNLEAVSLQFDWSSALTATDVLGAAIPGLTGTQQSHFSIAELA